MADDHWQNHNWIVVASLGHPAIGICAGRAFATEMHVRKGPTMAWFAGLAMLPDADYLAVALGFPDHGPFGHRGAAHSLALAAVGAAAAFALAGRLRLPARRLAAAVGLVIASHAVLDAMTGGSSRGVPLLWPLSFHRFVAPWRPIPDSPCGLEYVSRAGLRVAAIELVQFAPAVLYALVPRGLAARWLGSGRRAGPAPGAAAKIVAAATLTSREP